MHGLGLYIFEVNEPHNSVVVGIADKQEQLPAVCSSAPLPGIFVRLNWQFAFLTTHNAGWREALQDWRHNTLTLAKA